MEKIGILGGTFNPIHNGHLHLALEYARLLDLNRVLVIPTRLPPHKEAFDLAPGEARLEMCRAACRPYPCLLPIDLELRREGPSYTADTLKQLQTEYPQAGFYLILGSDMFYTVDQWMRSGEIFRAAALCTGAREPGEFSRLERKKAELELLGARCIVTDIPVMDISSTQVRAMAARGRDLKGLVPPAVAAYIAGKGLYQKEDDPIV